jgi:hypothetical protein
MRNVGEQVPNLPKVAEDNGNEVGLDKTVKVAVQAVPEKMEFSPNAGAPEIGRLKGVNNPYRCLCQRGNRCTMHLAQSFLPESRH